MLNHLHRQPRVIVFATMLMLNGVRIFGAEPTTEAARELTAARAAEALVRSKPPDAGEWRKMEAIYRDLARRYPNDVRVLNACGSFLWEIGKLDDGESLFRKAHALEPGNPDALSSLGAAALSDGNVRQAADYYTKACVAAPDSAPLHFNLANVLFLFRHDLKDTDRGNVLGKAMHHYSEACRLAPENMEYAKGRAETFYSLPEPDWPAALEAWRHLHRISPTKDFALANMATIHLKLGQKTEARQCVMQMNNPAFAARKARLLERIERE